MTLACVGIGISVSRSIAIGEAFHLQGEKIEAKRRSIAAADVEQEVARFQLAVETARRNLQLVREQIPSDTPSDITAFIDTHLLMLDDAALAEAPVTIIREHLFCAEWALQLRRNNLVRVFDAMEDPYLRTRKDDIDHVVNQIQKTLIGQSEPPLAGQGVLQGKIILAQDITPADTILMRHQGVAAFVTEFGGPMSHTAILARSLGIPAVVGVHQATQYLEHGEQLVVDGGQGVVLTNVDEGILEHFRTRLAAEEAHIASLHTLADKPALSLDGKDISLLTNIELAEDIEATRSVKATGVGLYRTEFLYMNRTSPPDEEEHYQAYAQVVEGLGRIPITIRTLDLGADKGIDSSCAAPPSCNPAMGLRAIRLCLKEPALFRPQLRAILRASALGPVRIMIPMLSSLGELQSVRNILEETKRELRRDGLAFDEKIPLGGMIEIPAAALSARLFARHLDFLSIGTNDLIQYTLAIDRMDDEVNYLYDPLHPAVLRLIQMTIDAGNAAGIPVSMCGEMAGSPLYIPLLLGMGLRRFSMRPSSVLEAKRAIQDCDIHQLGKKVQDLMQRIDDLDPAELISRLPRPNPD